MQYDKYALFKNEIKIHSMNVEYEISDTACVMKCALLFLKQDTPLRYYTLLFS